jgi:allophanate hydrolase subunit 1
MAGGACDIRGKAVTEYRAYSVGIDGHFTGCAPLTCANDAEAIARARMLVDDFHAAELWTGARLVERLSLVGTKFPEPVSH